MRVDQASLSSAHVHRLICKIVSRGKFHIISLLRFWFEAGGVCYFQVRLLLETNGLSNEEKMAQAQCIRNSAFRNGVGLSAGGMRRSLFERWHMC